MDISKTRINKAGEIICNQIWLSDEEFLENDYIVDEYRKNHLVPLTEVTLKLQDWLSSFQNNYYIAQRLKRKPQIIKKLKRLSVRLTQLQDIGGCRIIVDNNAIIDSLLIYIKKKLLKSRFFTIQRETDYRIAGRIDSGYRAVHLIVERNGYTLEVQIRSRFQHYWAESVERASVIYGYQLKELEGDKRVIDYFKAVSNIFSIIDSGSKPTTRDINEVDKLRILAEQIITQNDNNGVFRSKVNDSFIKGMISREANLKSKIRMINWLIIFNWKSGEFTQWSIIDRTDPSIVIQQYSEYEKQYPASAGYEVVVIGSSNVATIQHTHRHYFGIENYDSLLESIEQSIASAYKRDEIGLDGRLILSCLYQKGYWGVKKISVDTLRNHYCKDISDVDSALRTLAMHGLIHFRSEYLALNIKKKHDIENYIGASMSTGTDGTLPLT